MGLIMLQMEPLTVPLQVSQQIASQGLSSLVYFNNMNQNIVSCLESLENRVKM